MSTQKKDSLKSLLKIVLVMLVIIIATFALPKIVSCILPFVFAWVVSLIIKPVIKLLEKMHINRRIAVIISMLLVIFVMASVLYGISVVAIREIKEVAKMFKDTHNGIPVFVWDVIDVLPKTMQSITVKTIDSFIKDSSGLISSAVQSVLPQIGGMAGKLPGAFVFFIVFIIAIYFLSFDPKGIKEEIKNLVSKEKYRYLRSLKQSFSKACGGYIRAQLIIMAVVFCILLIGFLIMDVKFALLLALIISIIDAIPVLGTGIILNPWAVVCLLQGNYTQAIFLVCLYGVILLTRQFIEPRILSGQLGIHPLITLIAMYAGLKLVGIVGMILGPLVALVVINFVKINSQISKEKEETENVGE